MPHAVVAASSANVFKSGLDNYLRNKGDLNKLSKAFSPVSRWSGFACADPSNGHQVPSTKYAVPSFSSGPAAGGYP